MNVDPSILGRLSAPALESLATALESGWMRLLTPRSALAAVAGDASDDARLWFAGLHAAGFTEAQAAYLLRSVLVARRHEARLVPDLVISGPDVAGVPTADTHSVVQGLFGRAEREVVIAGYAFWNAKELFARLEQRMRAIPGLRVILHVDVPRRDPVLGPDSVVMRYAAEFRERHWPWDPMPEVWYDPRALSTDASERASLHAKMIVVDRKQLFLTSANFTEAAQNRNIEMGLLTGIPHLAETAAAYWDGLRAGGFLRRLPTEGLG